MKTALVLLFFTLMTSPAFALENSKTVCTYDARQRTIEVIYTGEGLVPCAVQYTKATSTETLWQAQLEEGYCEEKAAALIKKLTGWGWQCGETSNP